MTKKITITEKRQEIITKFKNSNIDSPVLDSSIIMHKALGMNKMEMFLDGQRKITPFQEYKINKLVNRRLNNEPIARIEKSKEFWGLEFGLNKDTLIPRPDSETIVESILENFDKDQKLKILDLGTGSGCLLLSVLSEFPNSTGIGIDLSKNALKQARKNALKLDLQKRSKFIKSNWFDNLEDNNFDIIISNPPYVKRDEPLSKEVSKYDPNLALFAENEGLECYEDIANNVYKYLSDNGKIFFEIGIGQKEKVSCIMKEAELIYESQKKDLKGVIRCLVFRKK